MKLNIEKQGIDNLLLNALPGPASVLDRNGEILYVNNKWKSFKSDRNWIAGTNGDVNYFDICQKSIEAGNDYALKLLFGLRGVIDGEKEKFDLMVPAGQSCFKFSVTPVSNSKARVLLLLEDVSRDMESVQSLRESKEVYIQHFKNTLAGIILGTPDGKIIDVNPAACKILGYSRDELVEGGRELIVDVNSLLNKKIYKVRAEKSLYEGEKEYIHKNGKVLTVEVSSVLYRNENSEIRTINTFSDKSKEKEGVQNLKEERRFTKTAINSIPNIFFVINEQLELVKWNSSFLEDLGYEDKDLLNREILDLVVENDRVRVHKVIAEAFETGTGHTIAEVLSKNKVIRQFHFYGNSFESKGKKYLVGTGTNITDLISIERENDKNYKLISQLFESSPLGMVMLKPDGRVMKANESFATLFEYSKLEIIGENLDGLIVDKSDRSVNEVFNEDVFKGNVLKKEAVRYTKHGKPLNMIINTVPIFEENKVVAAFGIYVDLTEQKDLESRIQHSLNEKEILLQEVHHRVKNNLAIIAGLLDLQIMEEDDSQIEYKLNEVRSRIFSIAKIHESLYGKEDVVQIRFDQYLESVLDALPQRSIKNGKEVAIAINTGPVTLNLNQAVPFGLAVNELMNVIFMDKSGLNRLNVSLKESSGKVEYKISGEGIKMDNIQPDGDMNSFHKTLIQIFLSQINGTLDISEGKNIDVKISFTKMNIRGSSSSVLNTGELLS